MVKLPPSRANRWVPCPGSAQAESLIPDRDTDSTFSGKKIHDAVAESLQLWKLTGEPQPVNAEKYGLDPQQTSAAAYLVADVVNRLNEKDLTGTGTSVEALHVEHAVPMAYADDQNGRLDVGLWCGKRGRIIIWDCKSGFVGVEAANDWQTLAYAHAVIKMLALNGFDDQHWIVELRIVQPNSINHDRTDVYMATAATLRARFNMLEGSAERATLEDPPTLSGPHCFDCRALSRCRTAKEAAARVIRYADTLDVLEMSTLEQADTVANLKPGIKLLEKMLDAMESSAITAIQSGEQVPGWTLQNKRGRSVWAVESAEGAIGALGLYGIDAAKPPELKALGEVRPLAERIGIDLTDLGFVKTVPGSVALTPTARGAGAAAFGGKNG